MSGVHVPGRRVGSLLDQVGKGLAIASQIYGIREADAQLEALEADRATKADQEAATKKARDEYNAGVLSKGKRAEMAANGATFADKPFAGAQPVFDKVGGPVVGYVGKAQKTAITPPKKELKEVEGAKGTPELRWIAEGETATPYHKPDKPDKDITVQERNTLQAQYDRDPNVRKNQMVMASFVDMQSLLQERSPAADQALIFAYMKALDPNSIVRESEAETAQALGAMGERAKAWFNKNVQGDGMLSDEQRKDLVNQVTKLAESAAKKQELLDEQFKGLAGRRKVDTQDLRFSIRPEFKTEVVKDGQTKKPAGPSVADIDAELKRRGIKPDEEAPDRPQQRFRTGGM